MAKQCRIELKVFLVLAIGKPVSLLGHARQLQHGPVAARGSVPAVARR
jgi:hypothetical protein